MMFDFLKKKQPEIVFECDNWSTRKYSPIRPAAEFIPEKFKNLPSTITKGQYAVNNVYSVKLCPGLQDYIGCGFVIPAWCDIQVKIENGHPNVRYSNPELKHTFHPPEQMGNFLDTKFPVRTPIKLDNPWLTYSKKDWSVMYIPLNLHENPYFEAVPGVIDHDITTPHSPINIMLKTDQDFIIKQGTPLVQLIPFKRQVVTARTGSTRSNTINRLNALVKTRFMSFNGWREFMSEKKHYKIDSHDLEIPTDTD
jgi:hypothetical protein